MQPATAPSFLPTNRTEMAARGWDELDVLFVTGDAYIDHPSFGVSLLGRLLESKGYRVGILAQPDWRDPDCFKLMGRPRLCAAVSAGAMDSMVNHYTAARRLRRDDAYSPGGQAGLRPNRAVIVYSAMLKGVFKGLPLLIGGIEASLRRLAHYDYWEDKLRRSILCDSKADLLLFGMAEHSLLEICRLLDKGVPIAKLRDIPGTALLCAQAAPGSLELPSFEEISSDRKAFGQAYRLSSEGYFTPGCVLSQQHGNRWLHINPPAPPLPEKELDRLYALPFCRAPHPRYQDKIPAFEQIRTSITSHRGCYGGCSFCSITHHQGKTIQSRSAESILAEIDRLCHEPWFRGTLSDIGGPTANMYGTRCSNKQGCTRPSCLFPAVCPSLDASDSRAVSLLGSIRAHRGVKHAFIASGIRYDLLDKQKHYFSNLLEHHVGGLLKVAPEHCSPDVTRWMRKPGPGSFEDFLRFYREGNRARGQRRGVVPYFIAGHPGCTLNHMVETALFLKKHDLRVEQVQEFTPTPGTYSTCLYYTGIDPYSGKEVACAKTDKERRLQKALLLHHQPELKKDLLEALRRCKREDLIPLFLGEVSRKSHTQVNAAPAAKKTEKRKPRPARKPKKN